MYRTPAKPERTAPERVAEEEMPPRVSMISAGPSKNLPVKTPENNKPAERRKSPPKIANVRKSIGEWEKGKVEKADPKPPKQPLALIFSPPGRHEELKSPKKSSDPANKTITIGGTAEESGSAEGPGKYKDRMTEAKACLQSAKIHLANARNMKTDRKNIVKITLERLYQLIKEAETELKECKGGGKENRKEVKRDMMDRGTCKELESIEVSDGWKPEDQANKVLLLKLEEHARLMRENSKGMEDLKVELGRYGRDIKEIEGKCASYASVVSGRTETRTAIRPTLHSVVVTAKEEDRSGEEVLDRVRKVLNAKDGGVEVERVRKARDRKIIIGCRTEQDREMVKERIRMDEAYLSVEDIKNKNPLVMITGVLKCHSDEELFRALRNQNKRVFQDLKEEDAKMEVAYRIQGRNLLTNRVVMRVPPKLWQKLTSVSSVRVDLQTLHVEDKSPLVQCSQCLGYGHGKRLCTEQIKKCSHCGGPHTRFECEEYLAGTPPTCSNCVRAKKGETGHNAFSEKCPVRSKWDELARAAVAYC